MKSKIQEMLESMTDEQIAAPEVPPPATAPQGPDDLTKEDFVRAVRMINAGKTNKEIAQALSTFEEAPKDGEPGKRFIRKVPTEWVRALHQELQVERAKRAPEPEVAE